MSERGAPMTAVVFRRMLTRLGQTARMPFGIHPHTPGYSFGGTRALRPLKVPKRVHFHRILTF
jgi:hypothetical protein